MPSHHKILLALVLLLLMGIAQAAQKLSMSTGVIYLSGDYGNTATTQITYIPFTLKHQTNDWQWKLTLPYLQINGPGGVLPDIGDVGPGTGIVSTESGMGDITASVAYNLLDDRERGVFVQVEGKVKIPSADMERGLGTGEFDYATEVRVYKTLGSYTPFASLGYRILGDNLTYQLDDVFYGSAGLNYRADNKSNVGLSLYLRQKTSASADPRQELSLYADRKLTPEWKLQGFLIKGFSDASPEWGAGATIAYSY